MAVNDNLELLDMAIEESDEGSIDQMQEETRSLMSSVEDLEFNRMFSNKMDPNSAFIDIQSGSGGTEAQDWADMLLRMYTRWAEKHEFSVSVILLTDLGFLYFSFQKGSDNSENTETAVFTPK